MSRLLVGFLQFMEMGVEEQDLGEAVATALEEIRKSSPRQLWDNVVSALARFAPKLLGALAAFAIGFLLVRLILKLVQNILAKSKIDTSLHYFIRTSVKLILYALVLITCLGLIGVPLTPLVTALGAMGLAVSLAVQGILSNLAGGLSILLNRPFSRGDFVEIGAQKGTVRHIRLVYTVLLSGDKEIFLPNGDVAKATVTVHAAEQPDTAQVELVFPVAAGSDIAAARGIIEGAARECPQLLPDPPPLVRVSGQEGDTVHILCRGDVPSGGEEEAKAFLIETIRTRLSRAGY